MRVYYLQTEYQPGRHRIVAAVYGADLFRFDDSRFAPFSALEIDEIDPDNKTVCIDIHKTLDRVDESGESKYYVNSSGEIMETAGWVEYLGYMP